MGRTGARLPAGVGLVDGRALEQGDGLGEGVGEEGEGGGKRGRVVGRFAREVESEEVDGLGEVRVEGVEGVDVDVGRGREGDGLGGQRAELEIERLEERQPWDGGEGGPGRKRTPLTMRLPTRVMVPLTLSLRGVLMTRVLPGSMGASRA